VKGKPKGKLTLQTSLLHRMSLVNKVASSLKKPFSDFAPINLINLLCDGGETHFMAWANSGAISSKKQTYT
jgi:hypothetical protein